MVRVKKVEVVASIDVGSNYIRMSIAEIGLKGDIIILENIIKTTNIGRDTFTTGRIAVQTIHETCDILKGFVRLMKDYRVIEYKAVSTSGIREAENKQYILEQIRLRTGINVEDINTAQERFFTYKAIRNQLKNIKMENAEQTLIVNITSGAVEISIYEEGQLKLTETVKVGSLRIREKLAGLETKTMDFNKLIRDFIESKIYLLKSNVINKPIKYFIGLGGELGTIAEVIKKRGFYSEKEDFISKETFDELCREIYLMSDEYISFTYDLPKKKSVLLLPSILIFQCFLEITDAEGIYIAEASLRQGILHDIAEKLFEMPEKIESFNDIISSAWYIVDKYGVNREHAAFVQNIALSIFDQTLKLHKLEERERLYLQIAAILHDVGCFIKIVGHNIHSYNIISKQDIIGFSNREMNIIASIARYHDDEFPMDSQENYYILSDKEKMTVSILAAILKLSEALDASHLQKIQELKLTIDGDNLYFNLTAKEDVVLEEWNFMNYVNFFEEVIGVKPII